MITKVEENSVGERAGVPVNGLLLAINGMKVDGMSAERIRGILEHGMLPMTLRVERPSKSRTSGGEPSPMSREISDHLDNNRNFMNR